MTKPQRGKTPRKPIRKNRATDPVQVYCRIRPVDSPPEGLCVHVVGPTKVQLVAPENSHACKNGLQKETQYTYQFVFDALTSQKALFDHAALPLVEDVLKGKNALLFAYGVTCSGKTYTMTGEPSDQGILPRSLDVIFNSIGDLQAKKYVFKPDKMNGFDIQSEADAMSERHRRDIMPKLAPTPSHHSHKETYDSAAVGRIRDPSKVIDLDEDSVYSVFVSYVEIYNNYIFDLLEELPYDPISGYKTPQTKVLREDSNHNMYVSGVVEIEVKSTEEAYEVLSKGKKRRKVAHTALNTESSRSHSVFNIRLVQAPLDPVGADVLLDKEKIIVSQLALVDLAGSERTGRTGSAGERLKEAGNINQSLMVLRMCIEALRENQQMGSNKMVSYRDSRLTHLFKNYFDGEGKVRMIVCVNPKANEYDETTRVMQFAELTQEVQIARSTQVRFDLGLQPGRRRLNQQYKTAVAKIKEGGGDLAEIDIPPPMVYCMGPAFPRLELKDPSDESTLQILAHFLKDREIRRNTLLTDLTAKQSAFRARLVEMEEENLSLKRKLSDMESNHGDRDTEIGRLTKRIKSLEESNRMLQATTTAYEQEKRCLEREVNDMEYKVAREKNEKDRIRQDYRAKLTLTEQQYHSNLEQEKRKLQQESHAAVRAKQKKIDMVKNIINRFEEDGASVSSASSTENLAYRHARSATASSTVSTARSTPDLSATPRRPGPPTAAKPHHARAKTTVTSYASRTRARSPPPAVKPKPAVNPRAHRRSKSSHEVWLDHKPGNTLETGTLLQPKLKKRRSVSKLTEKDTQKASKYVLTHQCVDSDGDVATKYVKGSIHATAGGGSAVIFNDVETLKQKDAGDKNLRHTRLHPDDYDGDWTDTEDRCKLAVEHHGQLQNRLRSSQV